MNARLATSGRVPLRRFSRQWFFDAFRTGLWVAIITVLIWVFADLQFTDEEDISAKLQVRVRSGENLALLEPTEEVAVSFHVKGNRYAIGTLKSRLADAGKTLRYDAARDLGPGRHSETTREILARLPEIRDTGLEVVSASPKSLVIHLDKLERIDAVPVKPEFIGGEAEDPKVEPEQVSLLVRAGQLSRIDRNSLLVKTRPFDLSGQPVGKEVKPTPVVVLAPPGLPGASVLPPVVRVSCKVGWQAEEEFIVRIDHMTPKTWTDEQIWKEYEIKASPPESWTRTIKVRGNRIRLEQLRGRKAEIKAFIELTKAAIGMESWETAEVKVILPPGLNVMLSPGPIRPVKYRLEKRAPAPAS